MENVKTLDDLKNVLMKRVDQISTHSFRKIKDITFEGDQKDKVLALYTYTQYIERKAFEMRLLIDEYIRATNNDITSFTIGDLNTKTMIKGSKMNDQEYDHPV